MKIPPEIRAAIRAKLAGPDTVGASDADVGSPAETIETAGRLGGAQVPQAEANYRDDAGSQVCGNCTYFNADDEDETSETATCQKVEGMVKEFGVCDLWEAKGNEMPNETGPTPGLVGAAEGGAA